MLFCVDWGGVSSEPMEPNSRLVADPPLTGALIGLALSVMPEGSGEGLGEGEKVAIELLLG